MKPVDRLKSHILENVPGATVYKRARHSITYQHPTEPLRRISMAYAGMPVHLENGTEIDTAWVDADPVADQPWIKKMELADYTAFFGNGSLDLDAGMPFRYVNPVTGDWLRTRMCNG